MLPPSTIIKPSNTSKENSRCVVISIMAGQVTISTVEFTPLITGSVNTPRARSNSPMAAMIKSIKI